MTKASFVVRPADFLKSSGPLLAALLLSLAAAAPLFGNPGFLNTRGIGDSPNLLFRVHQLLAAWSGWTWPIAALPIPARWMPDAAYGYGMPYFTYYASASTHLAALFKLYGFSFVNAIKLTQASALLVAAAGMYGWMRATGAPRAAAMLASVAYTFAPFHLVNLYVRGDSLAELWAMALYPLVFWAAQRCLDRITFERAFTFALLIATLICTHNISALNVMPFVVLYLVVGGWELVGSGQWSVAGGRWRSMGYGLLSMLWGVALAAFFWLPALGESQAVQLADLTRGFFSYTHHFRAGDLVQTSFLFDYEREPFSMGLVQMLLAALGLGALLWHAWHARRWPRLNTFLLLGLAIATWMITPLSQPVWEAVPLLSYTQFPWRFLSIQALFTAAVTSYWLLVISHWSQKPQLLITNYLLLSALLALPVLLPLRLEFILLNDDDVTAERLNLYEYFTTAIGNTVNSEYLPRDVTPRPFTSDTLLGRAPRLKVLSGLATGERLWKRGTAEQWQVEVTGSTNATVAMPTYYWPGWQAEVDGQPMEVRPAPGLGWIALDLPPGAHTLTLSLGRTPLRLGAEWLSVLSFILPVGGWMYRHARSGRRALIPPQVAALPWGLMLAIALLGYAILQVLPASISTLPLNMDYDTLAYPHRDRVRFSDGSELVQVTYSAERLQPGETLVVTTEWIVSRSGYAHFTLTSPAARVAGHPIVVAETTEFLSLGSGEAFTARLALPRDLQPGVYFVTVAFFDKMAAYPAVTDSGRARGLVHLAPIRVDRPLSQAMERTPLAAFGPAIRLITAQPHAEAGRLQMALLWQAQSEPPRNYPLALRLRDAEGNELAGLDVQTGYGFYPTTLWRAGEIVPDGYGLDLPPGLPPATYTTTVSLYDPLSLAPLNTASFPVALSSQMPPAEAPRWPLTARLALAEAEFPAQVAQGEALIITAQWTTLSAPARTYRARWTLKRSDDPADRPYHIETDLAPGSRTADWPGQASFIGRAHLPLPADLAPGTYALIIQLIDANGEVVGSEGELGRVEVVGRARDFTVPPVQTRIDARFDGQIALIGYDAAQSASELKLQLVFQALTAPRGDYKYFVHLFNPQDEVIAAQADAVPRNFTYPTTLWVKDEVVTESITLSLTAVPSGRYRVALGWYDPATPDLARLPALDAQNQRFENDRVILLELVK